MTEIVLEDEVTLFRENFKVLQSVQHGHFFNAQNQRIENRLSTKPLNN